MIGEYLRDCREEVGLTQADVAARLGYASPQFISNVERGLCEPASKNIFEWCMAVNADREAIIATMVNKYQEDLFKKMKLKF